MNRHNQSSKPALESIAALRGFVSGGAAWLKRYTNKSIERDFYYHRER